MLAGRNSKVRPSKSAGTHRSWPAESTLYPCSASAASEQDDGSMRDASSGPEQ